MKNIIDALNWRYAVQIFDQNKKLTDEQLNMILDAGRLAPSSFGLQPWKFIVVKNPETRAKLREAGFDQRKITEASHFVVFAVRKDLDEAYVDRYVKLVSETRAVTVESLAGLDAMLRGAVNRRTPEERLVWSTNQLYISLGMMLATAALEGIDAGPMEGFDRKKFDEILGLEEINLESRAALALGFRSDADPMSHAAKVRFPKEEVVVEIS